MWKIKRDHHASAVIDLYEVEGVPVLIRYPEYPAEHVATMHLARMRMLNLIEGSDETTTKLAPPAGTPAKQWQLWEPCEHCGSEPVYMPLHLCAQCWPWPTSP